MCDMTIFYNTSQFTNFLLTKNTNVSIAKLCINVCTKKAASKMLINLTQDLPNPCLERRKKSRGKGIFRCDNVLNQGWATLLASRATLETSYVSTGQYIDC